MRQSVVRRGGIRFILQRMGFSPKNQLDSPLWIHAASVGEVRAVSQIIYSIHEKFPDIPIVISTNTPEASLIIEREFPTIANHIYCSVDYYFATKRMISNLNARALLIVETEIWPNLYHLVKKKNIPLIIVNGRLTGKTLNSFGLARKTISAALKNVTMVLAKSEQDAENFRSLGVHREQIKVIGNIKMARSITQHDLKIERTSESPYILAVSTHEPEEQIIVEAVKHLSHKPKIFIAPRHPQRNKALKKALQLTGNKVELRSETQEISVDTDIYLIDTTGEVDIFMRSAMFVFVGGSLIDVGGHNVIEPAMHAKAVVCGLHTHNFFEEVNLLKHHNGIFICKDESELRELMEELVDSPELARITGKNAYDAVTNASRNILDGYLRYIEPVLQKHD